MIIFRWLLVVYIFHGICSFLSKLPNDKHSVIQYQLFAMFTICHQHFLFFLFWLLSHIRCLTLSLILKHYILDSLIFFSTAFLFWILDLFDKILIIPHLLLRWSFIYAIYILFNFVLTWKLRDSMFLNL